MDDPGDTLGSVEVSITSSENGGTSYFDQIVNFNQSGCTGNEYGYNVCTETASFTGPTLNNGTYWVNLQNASVPNGDPVYWDENSGPSQASQNDVGTIPSESFTILGSATTTTSVDCTTPENLHILYDFTGGTERKLPQWCVRRPVGKILRGRRRRKRYRVSTESDGFELDVEHSLQLYGVEWG